MRHQSEWGAVFPCTVCRAMTRPGGAPVAKHPGTVQRAGQDVCQTCYSRRQNGGIRGTPEELQRIKEALEAHTIKGLQNFLAARNKRQGVNH